MKAGVVQDEPRAKCRFCWQSFAAQWRLSTGEIREGWVALRQHVLREHEDRLTAVEYRTLRDAERAWVEEMGFDPAEPARREAAAA